MSGVRLPRIAVARQRPPRREAKVTGAIEPRGDELSQLVADRRSRTFVDLPQRPRKTPAGR